MPLYELDRHIAVGLYFGVGQAQIPAQSLVVVEDTVVGQGKDVTVRSTGEGVVVVGLAGAALCRHPGVTHDGVGAVGQEEPDLMGGEGLLVDAEPSAAAVGDAGGIGTPGLTGDGEGTEQPGLLPAAETVARVHQTEKAAHYASTSPSTGSLT